MTTLGKALVVVNLVLSGVLLAWAVNLYTHRTDWTDKAASGDKPAGALVAPKARAENDLMKNSLPAALAAWNKSRAELLPLEARRTKDWLFYETVMSHLTASATAQNPSRELKFDKGQVVLDKDGYPDVTTVAKDRKGNDLLSFNYYAAEDAKTVTALNKALDDYKAAIEQDSQLTDRMLGPQGLQQQMVDERNKRNDVIKEEEAVRPLLLNAVVEFQLLGKRQRQMEERVQELQKK
jgi:hypothetical protein